MRFCVTLSLFICIFSTQKASADGSACTPDAVVQFCNGEAEAICPKDAPPWTAAHEYRLDDYTNKLNTEAVSLTSFKTEHTGVAGTSSGLGDFSSKGPQSFASNYTNNSTMEMLRLQKFNDLLAQGRAKIDETMIPLSVEIIKDHQLKAIKQNKTLTEEQKKKLSQEVTDTQSLTYSDILKKINETREKAGVYEKKSGPKTKDSTYTKIMGDQYRDFLYHDDLKMECDETALKISKGLQPGIKAPSDLAQGMPLYRWKEELSQRGMLLLIYSFNEESNYEKTRIMAAKEAIVDNKCIIVPFNPKSHSQSKAEYDNEMCSMVCPDAVSRTIPFSENADAIILHEDVKVSDPDKKFPPVLPFGTPTGTPFDARIAKKSIRCPDHLVSFSPEMLSLNVHLLGMSHGRNEESCLDYFETNGCFTKAGKSAVKNYETYKELVAKLDKEESQLFEKNKELANMVSSYWKTCGRDGTKENAFYLQQPAKSPQEKPARYLIVCPGWYVGVKHEASEMLPRLEATVGHELGHGHRDAELYKNFDSCSGIKNADPLKEAALLSEAHSDVWGAETLAASFNPISDDQSLAQTVAKIFGGAKKENPYTDRLKTIRASLGWLCAPDDGAEDNTDPHPKNTYRLWLYMNNSSLRQALGCSVKENINSCSFM